MKPLILALFATTLLAPAVRPQKDTHQTNSSKDDDVREAVFRYEFKAVNRQADFYFIGVDNKNPSEEFLARFRDDVPLVRPISDARHEKSPCPLSLTRKLIRTALSSVWAR